jgi:hypothetical protein
MPISITRVYTRLGDQGETALVGGRRVAKDSPRIVAYGTVDELNAVVGLVRVFNAEGLRTRGRTRARHVWPPRSARSRTSCSIWAASWRPRPMRSTRACSGSAPPR